MIEAAFGKIGKRDRNLDSTWAQGELTASLEAPEMAFKGDAKSLQLRYKVHSIEILRCTNPR